MLANRLSHFYDLHGASITLDTACSSGLVATYAALTMTCYHWRLIIVDTLAANLFVVAKAV